jgi:GntR family transcriptional regulator
MNQSCQPNSRGARRTDAAGRDLAYIRVMRRLETDIATGRLTPGERLAPERQLGARLDVARNTLRRALTDLAARGLLVSRDRSGWFVKGGPVTIETISGPQGLTDWAAIHGLAVSSTVCQARIRPALEAEARALRIPMDSNVFELERVRIVEGAPLSLDQSVLVPSLAESLAQVDFSNASLYQTLRSANAIEPSRAECMLRAVIADRAERRGSPPRAIRDGVRSVRRTVRIRATPQPRGSLRVPDDDPGRRGLGGVRALTVR